MHSVQGSASSSAAGSSSCCHPPCQTCKYITPQTVIQGPQSSFTIHDRFTCQSENVVYSITCRRCTSIYIGETGRRLRERFSEHLRSIRKRSTGFPAGDHFNSDAHSLDDIMVCGMKQCNSNNTRRKQQEMRLIFELGTLVIKCETVGRNWTIFKTVPLEKITNVVI